jgi:hypothetical protein
MKNIHVLPSRFPKGIHLLDYHITSDEEIKEGEYGIDIRDSKVFKCERTLSNHYEFGVLQFQKSYCKKIILTTDQDLIKDDIQAIDDEFLEWFIKNPNCERVETERLEDGHYVDRFADERVVEGIYENYKIIIPKEEPKQDWYCPKCQSYVSSESVTFEETHQICNTSVVIKEPKQSTKDRILSETPELVKQKVRETANKLVEPKQETLEEVALKLYPIILEYDDWDKNKQYRDEWINGAKWQQQNIPICIYAENIYCHIENGVVIVEKNDKSVISYSEEDMRKAIQETITLMRYKATEFREHENTIIGQFKKK